MELQRAVLSLAIVIGCAAAGGCGYTQLGQSSGSSENGDPGKNPEANEQKLDLNLQHIAHLAERAEYSKADSSELQGILLSTGARAGRLPVVVEIRRRSEMSRAVAGIDSLGIEIEYFTPMEPFINCWVLPLDLRRLAALKVAMRIDLKPRKDFNTW